MNNQWKSINKKILVGVCLFFGGVETYETWSAATEAKSNKTVVWDKHLGGYIPPEYLSKREFNENDVLVEEYWGLMSIKSKTDRTSKTDSVIHALGSQRSQFARDLTKNKVSVITSSQSIGEWFNWNLSANWWFYRPLFESFDPKWNSPVTIQWKKTNESLKWKEIGCQITTDGQSLKVFSEAPGLYDLKINYQGPGKFSRSFSMIQNNLNYAYGANGFVALDPGSKFQQFPAILSSSPAELKILDINAGSRQTTKILGCSANQMVFPRNSGRHGIVTNLIQVSNSPFNLTDQNWTLGVANIDSAFFIVNTPRNLKLFKAGSKVVFFNQEERVIERVDNSALYLNIFLSGPKLQSDIHGYPNKFRVVNE